MTSGASVRRPSRMATSRSSQGPKRLQMLSVAARNVRLRALYISPSLHDDAAALAAGDRVRPGADLVDFLVRSVRVLRHESPDLAVGADDLVIVGGLVREMEDLPRRDGVRGRRHRARAAVADGDGDRRRWDC